MKEMHLFEIKGVIKRKCGNEYKDYHREENFKVTTIEKSFTEAEATAMAKIEEIRNEIQEGLKKGSFPGSDEIELECEPLSAIEYKGTVYFHNILGKGYAN